MSTSTVKRVIQEVGVAARETPRMYFGTVMDLAHVFRRFVAPHAHGEVFVVKKAGGMHAASHRAAPSSLRLGKTVRMKKQGK